MFAYTSPSAALFPGQGSQRVGMGRDLAEAHPLARATFEEADALLGFPLSRWMWEGPAERLNDTAMTQPALLVHSIAAWRVLQACRPDWQPTFMAGHSLGELSALVAAGALSFADGLRLVRLRGELMRQAGEEQPGGMAAVLGLDVPTLEALCAEVSTPEETVQVANDNAPGQVVVSGHRQAVARLSERAKAAGARRVIPLQVSVAAHSALMASAQAAFAEAVEATPIRPPRVPVIGNLTARPLTTVEAVREDLKGQLTGRVRWTETMRYLLAQGVRTFIEVGSGTVLLNLAKRFDRSLTLVPWGTAEDMAAVCREANGMDTV